MAWFKKEKRSSIENPSSAITPSSFLEFFGVGSKSASGITIDVDKALGVPAVWAAVNFLSGTLAGLPLNVYKKTKQGRERLSGGIAPILHDAVNDDMSSFDWRKQSFERVFTTGRSFTLIDRNLKGEITNLWPLNPSFITIKLVQGRKQYHYKEGNLPLKIYDSWEIIDIAFMYKSDGVGHYSPVIAGKDAIGLSISATNYGSKFFQDGGVPPFAISGPFQSGAGLKRAGDDIKQAILNANRENRLVLPLPDGHKVDRLGSDPDKSQLVELKKFCNEDIARIYSLPVVFVQDLTKGTFANTEQQDLHLVKHTIKRWVEQFEQELNLKLFGRNNNKIFAEFNLDGLLRGDFQTRMSGYTAAIQNALMTPNEARRKENLPDDPSGDKLMIQGATVPVENQLQLNLNGGEQQNV